MATANTMEKKYLELSDLEQSSTGPVWVINTTAKAGQAGNLLISIPKPNGNGADMVSVPKSFIPFDVTEQVPKMQVLASSDFRNSVRKRHVKILNPAYAKAILSTQEAKEEQRRIRNESQAVKIAMENHGVATTTEEEEEEDQYFDPKAVSVSDKKIVAKVTEEAPAAKKEAVKVSVRLQNLAISAKRDGLTPVQIKAKIKGYGTLDMDELKYLAREFKNDEKVHKYVIQLRDKLRAKM